MELLLENGASVRVKNGRGETPLDVVSDDWSPQLEGTYKYVGNLVGIELDPSHCETAFRRTFRWEAA